MQFLLMQFLLTQFLHTPGHRDGLSRKSFGTSRRIGAGPCSHLASPLRPGRGVLIRSVSRRLGSVAYVREDASPNEVS
jgi:hypothetical protein